jgi:hypothetical protein
MRSRTPLLLLLFSSLVSTAPAAPRKTIPLDVSPPEELPLPPIPPDTDSPYLAAPVPNGAITAPEALNRSQGPEISPGFYQPKDYNLGQGYLPGSTVQGEQEHRAKPMPSLNLKVPLQ